MTERPGDDHDRLEELFAVEALGGLDEADREELARALDRHGGECPRCRELRRAYREVAARLALVADEEEAPVVPLRPRRPSRLARAVAGVAAAMALAAAAGVSGYLLAPERAPEAALADLLARPGARVVQFHSEGGRGQLAVAFAPGVDRSFLVGTGLEAPPEGRVYQVWMIVRGSPVSGGVITPRDGEVFVALPADPSGSEAMAVTVEPLGGSPRPTSEPVFEAPLASS
jgi:hypothetical protein